ncbi:MAG: DUF5123 domain-containing protein, partial [Planctomycetes bacterium]|nr:DUF5123 domain-containing protein [Planctomycetota bacterium]
EADDLTLINCGFFGNTAQYDGGVMYLQWCDPVIKNCTFADNSALGDGGMMYHYNHTFVPTVTNSILWNNTPQEIYNSGTTSPTVTYCCVQGGCPGTGNIDEDPLLIDPNNGDFHIPANSPCVDAGSNYYVPVELTTDFEGDPRIVDGDGDFTETVDMGADEYYSDDRFKHRKYPVPPSKQKKP